MNAINRGNSRNTVVRFVIEAVLYTFRNFTLSALVVASHLDVLRGSSRVPAPRTSADLSEKKPLMGRNARRTPKNVCVGVLPW